MRKVNYKIRKTIIGVLNLIKFILFIGGACSWVFFICGLDSEGKAGDICLAGTILSMVAVLASFACEFIVVKFLLKPHEQLCTLIDYTIYDEYMENRKKNKKKRSRKLFGHSHRHTHGYTHTYTRRSVNYYADRCR